MNFTDPQLQKCYDSNFRDAGGFPENLRQVQALIAVHDLFQMQGPHSARVHETISHLLLQEVASGPAPVVSAF